MVRVLFSIWTWHLASSLALLCADCFLLDFLKTRSIASIRVPGEFVTDFRNYSSMISPIKFSGTSPDEFAMFRMMNFAFALFAVLFGGYCWSIVVIALLRFLLSDFNFTTFSILEFFSFSSLNLSAWFLLCYLTIFSASELFTVARSWLYRSC